MTARSEKPTAEAASTPALVRRLGLAALIFYGVGDILGAGIYALVGKVAGIAGQAAWLSFAMAAVLAAVTGLSYAELAARVPRSAGAAAYVAHAFRHPLAPFLTGFFVLVSGVTSTATVSLAFYGYLKVFWAIPQLTAAIGLIAVISWISFWGIRESASTNNVLTMIEVSGLLLVITAGFSLISKLPAPELAARIEPDMPLGSVIAGATLAFYAFIGFEDLANLAQEAKNPTRDIPRAILMAVGIATVLYLVIIFIVLCTGSAKEAAASAAPLLDVIRKSGFPISDKLFAPVALFAVCNTGLANLVMASRLLYGMADQGLLPKALARVHPVRRTPWVAVLASMVLCILLVVSGGVSVMAQTTSLLLVSVFLAVHASLIVIRRCEGGGAGIWRAPRFIPYVGILFCLLLMTRFPPAAYARLALTLAAGLVSYYLFQPKRSNRTV